MADSNDAAADKADIKAGRRTSFARNFHVPGIARRVKQFESAVAENTNKGGLTPTPAPAPNRRLKDVQGDPPERKASPKPQTASVHAWEITHYDEDVGGAEIPNIPLRRSSNMSTDSLREANSDLAQSSLTTLERIMAVAGPPPANSFNPTSHQRPERRYDGQLDDLSLYPVSERSVESSTADDREASSEMSFMREASSSPDLSRTRTVLPQRRESAPARSYEPSVELPASPVKLRPSTPSHMDTSPFKMESSPAASSTTAYAQSEHSTTLPPLQARGLDESDGLNAINEEDSDPNNFDLIIPVSNLRSYNLEHRSELLFSVEHLRVIFADPTFLHRFMTFIHQHRSHSVPLLNYALDALKAIRAMDYVNQIISQNLFFENSHTQHQEGFAAAWAAPELTENKSLRQKSAAAFEALARDELPAYVTQVWTEIVELSVKRKIIGTMPSHLQDSSEGLAEVFCITDPSRRDNPIVFASEEFHRTTQYGPDYVLGRNSRFLQGPRTNQSSIQRIREKMSQNKEHFETFLNYRRDGQPFMNLLVTTPLVDSMGNVRYWLGAQIDVSGLAKDCSGLESLRRLVDHDEEERRKSQREDGGPATNCDDAPLRYDSGADGDGTTLMGTATTSSATRLTEKRDGFRGLAEMFSRTELETTRRFGGRHFHSQQEQGQQVDGLPNWHRPRVVLSDHYEPSPPSSPPQGFGGHGGRFGQDLSDANGNITLPARQPAGPLCSPNGSSTLGLGSPSARSPTVFENYLVARPYPSLRILFASPSLRVPGTLQSHLMARIGGSRRIHEELEHAFAHGQSVTAKVKWLPSTGLRNAASNHAVLPDHSSGSTGGTTATSASYDTVGMEGRPRWIHCTPLLGANGAVGVWIIVIVDDAEDSEGTRRRVKRNMGPVVTGVGGGGGRNGGWQASSAPGSVRGAVGGTGTGTGGLGQVASDADEMSLSDYAWHSLPEDPDARRHVRDMYEETKRRERVLGALSREWERGGRIDGWGGDTDRDSQRSELRARNNNNNNNNNTSGGGAGAGGDVSDHSTPTPLAGNGNGNVSSSMSVSARDMDRKEEKEEEVGKRTKSRSPKRASSFGGMNLDRKSRVKSPPPEKESTVMQTVRKLGYM